MLQPAQQQIRTSTAPPTKAISQRSRSRGWRTQLRLWLDRLRESFWFIPAVLSLVAVVAGMGLPYFDSMLGPRDWLGSLIFLYDTGPEGARSVLGAVASSSITVAATVFSITIATLTLTSSQFGPRLLRTFTSDRGVQFALGTFVATFIYPLLVLRVIHTGDDEGTEPFVPHLSVMLALVLALLATAVLIYFVDHVSRIIQAPQVIAAVGKELDEVLDKAIPFDGSQGDQDAPPAPALPDLDQPGEEAMMPEDRNNHITGPSGPRKDLIPLARAAVGGFVAVIDYQSLLRLAERHQATLWLNVAPGSYVYENTPLVSCRATDTELFREKDVEDMGESVGISSRRTLVEDPVFAINQLAEIAQRAMSPGINDPFTCQTCIDRLAAALARVAARPFPDPRMRDSAGIVRVVRRPVTWEQLVAASFDPIRRYARGDAAVMGRQLDALRQVVMACPRQDRRLVLRAQGEAALNAALDSGMDASDIQVVRGAHGRLIAEL